MSVIGGLAAFTHFLPNFVGTDVKRYANLIERLSLRFYDFLVSRNDKIGDSKKRPSRFIITGITRDFSLEDFYCSLWFSSQAFNIVVHNVDRFMRIVYSQPIHCIENCINPIPFNQTDLAVSVRC